MLRYMDFTSKTLSLSAKHWDTGGGSGVFSNFLSHGQYCVELKTSILFSLLIQPSTRHWPWADNVQLVHYSCFGGKEWCKALFMKRPLYTYLPHIGFVRKCIYMLSKMALDFFFLLFDVAAKSWALQREFSLASTNPATRVGCWLVRKNKSKPCGIAF